MDRLIGEIIESVEVIDGNDKENRITFYTQSGRKFVMEHYQD